MKDRKARIRAKDKKRIALIASSLFILFVAISVFLIYYSASPNQPEIQYSGLRAAIVDHLSLTFPNETFVETATNMLKQANFTVDYYPGENVTVDLYRNLAAYDYKLIILRVHAGISENYSEIGFFTSEAYSKSEHVSDLSNGWLGTATYHNPPDPGETAYFAIRASFVKDAMKGTFNQTTIIMTGCYGMRYPSMAEAFVQKGAKIYIGWSGLENADHSDETTITLLRHLILQNQTVGQAVQHTMDEVGEDPQYKSQLDFYPSTSTGQTVLATARASENGPTALVLNVRTHKKPPLNSCA